MIIVLSPMVLADVLPVGFKGIDYCFQISNIDDYPDYTFIISPAIHPEGGLWGHNVVEETECIRTYKISRPKLYAIKTVKFDESEIEPGYESINTYFESNRDLIKSDIEIKQVTAVPGNNPLTGMVDVLDIVHLSEDSLGVRKSKAIYTYEDGTREEKLYIDQDKRPKQSKNAILPWWFALYWYIIIPIIAVLAIIIIFLINKFKK